MPRDLDQIISQYNNVGAMNTPTPAPPPYQIMNAYGAPSMKMNAGTVAMQMTQMARMQMPPPMMPMGVTPGGMGGGGMMGGMDPYENTMASQVQGLGGYEDIVNQRATRAGGSVGAWGGTIAGGVMGSVGGPGGMASGAMTGNFFGGMIGGVANKIPGIGHALRGYQRMRWGGAMEQMAAGNQLQQGMYGNVSLGQEAMGAGGSGINPMAANQLVQALGTTQGGGFKRQDMINMTGAAAQSGFLDAATNVEQIAGIVKKLTSVMGSMAKLTGDPDFRNNMRELGQLRNMGLSIDQSMQTLKDIKVFGRMAGSGQAAQMGAQMGAQLFQAQGLTGGLGAQIGAGATGMANLSMGGLTDIQRGLMGGKEGVAGLMTQSQANFLGGTAQMIIPYVSERGPDGKLRINKKKLAEVQSGKIGLQEIVGRGSANLAQMGYKGAQDLISQAPELQVEMGQTLGAVGTFVTMANQTTNLMKGRPELTLESAASFVAGGRESGNLLASQMRDPEMRERMKAQLTEEQRRIAGEGRESRLAQLEQTPGAVGRWAEDQVAKIQASGGNMFTQMVANNAADQRNEAWKQANAQQKQQDAALGFRRQVTGRPGAVFSEREMELAAKRGGSMEGSAAWINKNTSAWDRFGGESAGDTDVQGRQMEKMKGPMGIGIPTGRRELGRGDVEAADILGGRDVWYRSSYKTVYDEALGGFHPFSGRTGTESILGMPTSVGGVRGEIGTAAEAATEGGAAIAETRKYSQEDFERGEDNIQAALQKGLELSGENSASAVVGMKYAAREFAREMGSQNKGIDPRLLRAQMVKALVDKGGMSRRDAEKFVKDNEKTLTRQAYNWIDQGGGEQGKRALLKTEDAAASREIGFDLEKVTKNEKDMTEEVKEAYEDLGLAASDAAPSPEEERGIAALFEETDPEIRALAMLQGGGKEGVSKEARAALEKVEAKYQKSPEGKKKWRRAQEVGKKLESAQSARLAERYGKEIGEGKTDVETMSKQLDVAIGGQESEAGDAGKFAKLRYRTQIAKAQKYRKDTGKDVEQVGEGAGLGTAGSAEKVKDIEGQKKMLDDMATNMNKASKTLLEAAKSLQSETWVEKIVRYTDNR